MRQYYNGAARNIRLPTSSHLGVFVCMCVRLKVYYYITNIIMFYCANLYVFITKYPLSMILILFFQCRILYPIWYTTLKIKVQYRVYDIDIYVLLSLHFGIYSLHIITMLWLHFVFTILEWFVWYFFVQ